MESEKKTESVWKRLKEAEKPIVMYGMGDGAEKIMKVMDNMGIKPKEFMACLNPVKHLWRKRSPC